MYGARLIVHGVDAEAWAKRYSIEAFSYPCSECGKMATTSIPFAQGAFRGLQSPPCECGNEQTPYGLVHAHGDLFTGAEAPARRVAKRAGRVIRMRPR